VVVQEWVTVDDDGRVYTDEELDDLDEMDDDRRPTLGAGRQPNGSGVARLVTRNAIDRW
jgi:hypothetical protein